MPIDDLSKPCRYRIVNSPTFFCPPPRIFLGAFNAGLDSVFRSHLGH
jgi:hypothetical protein